MDKSAAAPLPPSIEGGIFPDQPAELRVTLQLAEAALLFEWVRPGQSVSIARGWLLPQTGMGRFFRFAAFTFQLEPIGVAPADRCGSDPTSAHAMMRRIRARTPAVSAARVGVVAETDLGPAKAGVWQGLVEFPSGADWRWLGRLVAQYAKVLLSFSTPAQGGPPEVSIEAARGALTAVAAAQLGLAPARGPALLGVRILLDSAELCARFEWSDPDRGTTVAVGVVRTQAMGRLRWELSVEGGAEPVELSPGDRAGVREKLGAWLERFKTDRARVTVGFRRPAAGSGGPESLPERLLPANEPPYPMLEESLVAMAEEHVARHSPLGRVMTRLNQDEARAFESYAERARRKEQKRADEQARRREIVARLAEERRQRDEKFAAQRAATEAKKAAALPPAPAARSLAAARPPPPPVPVVVRLAPLTFQDTAIPLADLKGFALRERAALWWVSNQSDDLLCLPHCRIQRLDYQLRTALRVLGPLRGRALLSDEVGLGKTIEAGLIAKELFTRGMAKRFLVLTLPSLVDQWADELDEKFGLASVTTNQAVAREDPARFWRENPGIVASLHTLKQPAQLAIAREVHWDLLIVDEAHYLRNRTSQAWQAVDALPRQFLLLLTATPVQNSLEELYNLVTLLQPGQLPSPKEFRARFLDPQRPRQPREPEELRRLLGQVMIRNTRANAGIDLPPRRAETVVFSPDAAEEEFWREWEGDFRARLATLGASQASLWGRLLLQAAGSSPAAWRAALGKFPDAAAARSWRERAPLESSWRRKCELLLPLTRGENGAVVFTQFLDTQAALAEFLRGAGVPTFVVNGATPAPERQPITEEFRQHGGALLLTHSGTEGRNLQFCRTLANFDLPWNPMEIEQRIGRLHRLGQKHPVQICNFVQAGTLQEHLLEVLQEKLNLFELVVGETGLVLGERFSGDEFEEEIFRRWQTSDGRVAAAIAGFGEELAAARGRHAEVKELDATLFAHDFEST